MVLFILLWIGVAVPLAFLSAPRPALFAYGGATLLYSFFVAFWAMLRTIARLRGVVDEGGMPDSGLVLEALPQAAVIVDVKGRTVALNNKWLDFFVLARNHVWSQPYKNYCDPALRRAIDRTRRSDEAAFGLALSARTSDGRNVFFRADVTPLGAGWLICATPEKRAEKTEGPFYEEDRLYQFGRVGASLLPELNDRLVALRKKTSGHEGIAELDAALAMTGQLDDLLNSPAAKPSRINPGTLLRNAAQIVQPAFDRQHTPLKLHIRDNLPAIAGNVGNLTYALIVVLLSALEEVGERGQVAAHARGAGEDVEFLIAAPIGEETEIEAAELFTPTLTGPSAGLAVARQIFREHDGNLLYHAAEHAGAQFLIQLPSS